MKPVQHVVIPIGAHKWAVIPLGITVEDFKKLQKTLKLWKNKMTETAPERNKQ